MMQNKNNKTVIRVGIWNKIKEMTKELKGLEIGWCATLKI